MLLFYVFCTMSISWAASQDYTVTLLGFSIVKMEQVFQLHILYKPTTKLMLRLFTLIPQ